MNFRQNYNNKIRNMNNAQMYNFCQKLISIISFMINFIIINKMVESKFCKLLFGVGIVKTYFVYTD